MTAENPKDMGPRIGTPEWLREQAAYYVEEARLARTQEEANIHTVSARSILLEAIRVGHEIQQYGPGGIGGRLNGDPFDLEKLVTLMTPIDNGTGSEAI